MLLLPPTAFVVSLVALFRDGSRGYAMAGLILGGIPCLLMLFMAFR